MSSQSEEPQLQNGTSDPDPEHELRREEPATGASDPSVAVEDKAEPVAFAGEAGEDHKNSGSEFESNPNRSEDVSQEAEVSQQDVDLKLQKDELAPSHPDAIDPAPVPDPTVDGTSQTEVKKDEGERTFTMRELLNGEKNDQGQSFSGASGPDLDSVDSQDNSQLNQIPFQDSATTELINSITGADEQGQPRQRILAFAARRFASAIQRNPEDYDALYNWALILQESADCVDPDSTSPSKDALLEEACKRYEEATDLCPTLHDAYYNWAIAISDRARMRGRTKEGEEMWKQATKYYEKAVKLTWNSPQALNNWGLALQELSTIVPAKEKLNIVSTAIKKFRAAIQLQFDFHRAIYNLGTVLYGLAEDTLRVGVSGGVKEASANDLYSQCAIYIAAAHALKPNNSVYRSALRLVRSMLPLPYLKVGYFTAPPIGNPTSPHSEWKKAQFVLNHEGLYQLISDDQKPSRRSLSSLPNDAANGARHSVKVEIPDIVSVSASADLTLPPGAGLCVDTTNGPVYLVAESWESLDGWVDALRLVYTIFAKGKSDVLAGVLAG